MTDQTKPEFDPRFSSAFQRGFDPAQSDAEGGVAAASPAASMTPRSLISTPPQVAPVHAQPVAAPVAAPATVSASPTSRHAQPEPVLLDAPADHLLVDPESDSARPAPSGRNPFLIVLGVLSIALVALGCWLFLRAGAAFNSREVRSQGDFNSLSATITAAPFVVLLGVATAIALLFVFASRWSGRSK